jgi:hypothetical protein
LSTSPVISRDETLRILFVALYPHAWPPVREP